MLAGLSRRRAGILVLLVLVTLGLLGLVNWRYREVQHDNEALFARRATERANAVASQLCDTIVATLLQADVIQALARLMTEARLAGDTNAEAALRPYLERAAGYGGPDVAQIAAIGADGAMLWSNLDWNPSGTFLGDREHFKAFATDPTLKSFFGRPVRGRTSGEWSVQFARAMRDGGGTLRAVTVVSLRASMLARLGRDLDLAPDDTLTLLRDDGVVLMRRDLAHMGEMIPMHPGAGPEAMKDGKLSAQPSALDGVPRYVASRPIPGTPLILHVGLSRASQMQALAEVREALWRWSLLLDIAIIGLACAGGFAVMALRRYAVIAARADSFAQSEAWFRAVIDDMAEGVLVLDGLSEGDFHISYANRQAGEIFGLPVKELIGRDLGTLYDPSDRDEVEARKQEALQGRQLGGKTYRTFRPDGGMVWIRTSSVVAPSPLEPTRLRMITSIRDVTEEHGLAQVVAAMRERVDRILQVIPGVFYQLIAGPDRQFRTAFVSESVSALFGVSVEDASRPGFLSSRVAGDLNALRLDATKNVGPYGIAVVEYPVQAKDRDMWMRDTLRRTELPDGGAEVVGFIADASAEHATDLARRAAEEQLQRRNWALAAYSRSLSTLIRSGTLDELVKRVCEDIVQEDVYVLACVGLPEAKPGKPVRIVASAGTAIGYVNGLALSWSADVEEGRGPTGIAVREGLPHIMRDTLTDPGFAPWRDKASAFGMRSTVTVPCKIDDRVVAVLLVYASVPDAFGVEELALFQRLSYEIGFAMELEAERTKLQDAEAAKSIAEDNLLAAAQLGPGVLYRARVDAAAIRMLLVFGDPARVTHDIAPVNGCPVTLDMVLGRPDHIKAILALADDGTMAEDFALQATDGRTHWVRDAVRVTARSGDMVEVVGYISEVTKEKEQQLHQQQLTTLLTLGEMATGMAHELNQPLAGISFAAQNGELLLSREPVDLRALSDKFAKIGAQTRRASRLIDHMRVFARNEHEDMRPVAWREVLDSAMYILRPKLRGCIFHDAVHGDLPDVMGAPIPMEQVLINLISNAIDAYETSGDDVPREVTVSGSVDDDHVALRVTDRAGGIPPHILSRVFEPFFTTKPPGKGTGLGLSLAFGTIVEMGGTITAGNENGGAVFEIRLPKAAKVSATGIAGNAHDGADRS